MSEYDLKIKKFESLIKESKSTVVFTGAGISTLSNIPDFRGINGVYNSPYRNMRVEQILDITFFFKTSRYFLCLGKRCLV